MLESVNELYKTHLYKDYFLKIKHEDDLDFQREMNWTNFLCYSQHCIDWHLGYVLDIHVRYQKNLRELEKIIKLVPVPLFIKIYDVVDAYDEYYDLLDVLGLNQYIRWDPIRQDLDIF